MIALILLLYHGFAASLGFSSIVANFDALMFTFLAETVAEVLIGMGITLLRN